MSSAPSADSARRATLRRRAAALARVPSAEAGREDLLEVVEFSLAGGRYAVASASVSEVLPFTNCTPLPCTPAFIPGLVNVRGRFVHVIEVGRFLGLPARGIVDLHHVLLVRHAGIELGILADLVTGLRRVSPAALLSPPPALAGAGEGHVRGVTADGLAVLDVPSILSDPRQVVEEEVDL